MFLDEIQCISDWSGFLRALYSRGFRLFVTGSSSKLLSRETASGLRGRCKTILVLPFSFREYLRVKNVDVLVESYLSESLIRNYLREYLLNGGYPRVVLSNDVSLLKEYMDTIFYRDIIERYKVRDTISLRIFLRTILSTLGLTFSINKVYKEFKSLGLRKSKKTIIRYLRYFIESMFIIPVKEIGKALEPIKQPIKIYPIDTGFLNYTPHRRELSTRLESIVAIELYHRYGSSIYYWRDYSGREVDFVVTNKFNTIELIQVTYELRIDDKK